MAIMQRTMFQTMRPQILIPSFFRKPLLSPLLLSRYVHIPEEGHNIEGPKITRVRPTVSREGHNIPWNDVKSTYVDTHCHLFSTLKRLKKQSGYEDIPDGRVDLFAREFFPKSCTSVIDIHSELPVGDNYQTALSMTEWPEGFKYRFAMGAHPRIAHEYTDEAHDAITKIMSNPSCVAWGKCGLSYHQDKDSPCKASVPIQQAVFARQLAAAVSLDKPIVIHTREAPDDTLSLIRQHVPREHNIHVHCFTYTPELARTMLAEYPNLYIGIAGVIMGNKMEHVRELIISGELPLERILLESDSPFMVPANAIEWLKDERPNETSKRFVVSHSGMIPFIAKKVAGLLSQGSGEEVGVDKVLEVTKQNAGRMYRFEV